MTWHCSLQNPEEQIEPQKKPINLTQKVGDKIFCTKINVKTFADVIVCAKALRSAPAGQTQKNTRIFGSSSVILGFFWGDWFAVRPYIRNEYLASQQKIWKHATTAVSSIDMDSSSNYMTGGTLTSAVEGWSSRVSKKDVDPSGMGRWSSVTFVGRKNTKTMIITGYRCVRSSGAGGAWAQEKIFMRD